MGQRFRADVAACWACRPVPPDPPTAAIARLVRAREPRCAFVMPRFQRPYVWKEEEREQHGFVSLKHPDGRPIVIILRTGLPRSKPAPAPVLLARAPSSGVPTVVFGDADFPQTCTKRGPGSLRDPAVFAQA